MKRLLVANRGEIARRIFRTAHAMGIETVAVYSDADQGAPHVREAGRAVRLGAAPAAQSYLNAEALLQAVAQSGADALHPGYGFLSENPDFAEQCAAAGVVFVGPAPASMRAMGLKDRAKDLMRAAGVPVAPGYGGDDQSLERLQQEADAIGYPVLIKAVAGGGGKGMRRVDARADFAAALESCQREAARAFGEARVLVEKFIVRPRHVEVQIFGDTQGNVVHLFERDCSVQRRHQKVLEEAPAPGLSEGTRARLYAAAVAAARAVAYVGAGTVEFIMEGAGEDPAFFFMEMNTRLQVEHPVTEMITGLDLVAWQLQVARGEPLPLPQEQIQRQGWAVEARLYAEDVAGGFLPASGPLHRVSFPAQMPDRRVETGVVTGGAVSPHYDPMIAKLVACGPTRGAAIETLVGMLDQTVVEGVITNRAFLARTLASAAFRSGVVTTDFLDQHPDLQHDPAPSPSCLVAAALALAGADDATGCDPWSALTGWRMARDYRRDLTLYESGGGVHRLTVACANGHWTVQEKDQETSPLWVRWEGSEHLQMGSVAGQASMATVIRTAMAVDVRCEGQSAWLSLRRPPALAGEGGDGAVLAPMPGLVIAVGVAVGARVQAGQRLLTLEAMKMEHALAAPFAGLVTALEVAVGSQVRAGTRLIMIEKD